MNSGHACRCPGATNTPCSVFTRASPVLNKRALGGSSRSVGRTDSTQAEVLLHRRAVVHASAFPRETSTSAEPVTKERGVRTGMRATELGRGPLPCSTGHSKHRRLGSDEAWSPAPRPAPRQRTAQDPEADASPPPRAAMASTPAPHSNPSSSSRRLHPCATAHDAVSPDMSVSAVARRQAVTTADDFASKRPARLVRAVRVHRTRTPFIGKLNPESRMAASSRRHHRAASAPKTGGTPQHSHEQHLRKSDPPEQRSNDGAWRRHSHAAPHPSAQALATLKGERDAPNGTAATRELHPTARQAWLLAEIGRAHV